MMVGFMHVERELLTAKLLPMGQKTVNGQDTVGGLRVGMAYHGQVGNT